MIIPIRCISCGTPISGKWEKYKEKVSKGQEPGKVLDELGIAKYCCRALFLTHKDLLKEVSRFRL